MKNVSDKYFRENQNHNLRSSSSSLSLSLSLSFIFYLFFIFYFFIFFLFYNSSYWWDKLEKYCRAGQAAVDNKQSAEKWDTHAV